MILIFRNLFAQTTKVRLPFFHIFQHVKALTSFCNRYISEMDMRDSCIREFIAKAKQYIEMPKLMPELLRVFIRKIEVFEKMEKYSRKVGNLINIHYAFQLSEQDGMPMLKMLLPSNMRETA